MSARTKILSAALALTFLFFARPGGAALFDFDARAYLDLQVNLTQAALADGSVRLAPGRYDVHVTTSADGSVRAGFFQGGVKRGEARGIIAVRKAGGEKTQTFKSLGFNSASPATFRPDGQKLSFAISAPNANQILIGLLLPAVH